MTYPDQLEAIYQYHNAMTDSEPCSRLAFLGGVVFGFTTYDEEMDEHLAGKMLEVVRCILDGTTFQYIEQREQYVNFLLMVNAPFLSKAIDWGTSIRGAFFVAFGDTEVYRFRISGYWDEGAKDCEEVTLTVTEGQVPAFMEALLEWTKREPE
jgi:hypothetical protein